MLYSLLSKSKMATREGHAGQYASINLPGYGRWFANGVTYEYPNSEIVQNESRLYIGQTKPDTFRKDCCDCPTAL